MELERPVVEELLLALRHVRREVGRALRCVAEACEEDVEEHRID